MFRINKSSISVNKLATRRCPHTHTHTHTHTRARARARAHITRLFYSIYLRVKYSSFKNKYNWLYIDSILCWIEK